jgi:hypothetical protein
MRQIKKTLSNDDTVLTRRVWCPESTLKVTMPGHSACWLQLPFDNREMRGKQRAGVANSPKLPRLSSKPTCESLGKDLALLTAGCSLLSEAVDLWRQCKVLGYIPPGNIYRRRGRLGCVTSC